jgi:hypothetical protein
MRPSLRRTLVVAAACALAAAGACSTFSSEGDAPSVGPEAGADADAAADATPPAFADAVLVGRDDAGIPLSACALRADAVFLGYRSSNAGPRRMERDGGAVTSLAAGSGGVVDLVADAYTLYWISSACTGAVEKSDGTPDASSTYRFVSCSLARVTRAGAHLFVTSNHLVVELDPITLAPTTVVGDVSANFGAVASDDTTVFAGTPSGVVRMDPVADAAVTPFVDAGAITDLRYDPTRNRIFWATSSAIGSLQIDGGGAAAAVSGTHVDRVAVDDGILYWTDRITNRIWRTPLDASSAPAAVDARGEPIDLAVEATGLVWCNADGSVWTMPRL